MVLERKLLCISLLVFLAASHSWSETFEGRSTRKNTKAEAIRDAENDLGGRIGRSISMQMAVRSERIRTAVGSNGSYSSNYLQQDTMQAKSLVSWSGFNPKVISIDSGKAEGKKYFEALVRADFDRAKFIEEKHAKVALLKSQWGKLADKNLMLFLDAVPKFYEEYDKQSAEGQPAETMQEWESLRNSIDSVYNDQLSSVQVSYAPVAGFDPCGKQRIAGLITATSKGVVIKPNWLEISISPSNFRTQADVNGMRAVYAGRCVALDSVKASVRVRGIAQPIAEPWLPLHANTVRIKYRGNVSIAEQLVLQKMANNLFTATGLQPVDSAAVFNLSLEPKTDCEIQAAQGLYNCRLKVQMKLLSSTGSIWEQALEARGYGDTQDGAREDAVRTLASGADR